MTEKEFEKLIPVPEVVEPEDIPPAAVNAPALETSVKEIDALKEKVDAVFETDYKKAFDISIVRHKFKQDSSLQEVEVVFTLKEKQGGIPSSEHDKEFKITHKLDRTYVNFSITSMATGQILMSGSYYENKRGKQIMSLGAKMGSNAGLGYYSQFMDGLLQGVDITEGIVNNTALLETFKDYGTGDYVVPSVFAARAQLVAARKGFLCFITFESEEGAGAGIHFVGVRVPDELKEILEKAKQWERANDNDQKTDFKKNYPGYDPLQEANKIREYMEANREALAREWGFYERECVALLDLQIERFEEMAKGIDKYELMEKRKPVKEARPKSWWHRIF